MYLNTNPDSSHQNNGVIVSKRSMRQDPLCCPKCSGEMKIVSFITDQQVIRQILKHLGLWTPTPSRDPPGTKILLKTMNWFMNFSMTCLRSTHRQMVVQVTMNPVLRQIKPSLYPLQDVGWSCHFLSIICEKSGNVLHITHPLTNVTIISCRPFHFLSSFDIQ